MTKISSSSQNVLFQHPDGWIYHGGALLYVTLTYTVGIAGLFSEQWSVNAIATLLLAHSMVIAAYLLHECAHNTIFRENRDNAILGSLLMWVCGTSYGTYEDIRYKHFRHHVDNDDVVWFDYMAFFQSHPRTLRITKWLEWMYIPAHDLIMHFILIFTSFIIPQRRNQRRHNIAIILLRGGLYLWLLVAYPGVAILYAIAYMGMIIVLRFMDSLQHDYAYHTNLFGGVLSEHKGDRNWEQEHTFSNFISHRYPALNLLVLNFCYHNAHHAKPTTPWFNLPRVHRELVGDSAEKIIPLKPQLILYHRNRCGRIAFDDPALLNVSGHNFLHAAQRALVSGGNAASFLTPF
tara:strand:+ start:88606 stop:89649 length:1044 start_codon:yes stop_codon:yes gene_type:complete